MQQGRWSVYAIITLTHIQASADRLADLLAAAFRHQARDPPTPHHPRPPLSYDRTFRDNAGALHAPHPKPGITVRPRVGPT